MTQQFNSRVFIQHRRNNSWPGMWLRDKTGLDTSFAPPPQNCPQVLFFFFFGREGDWGLGYNQRGSDLTPNLHSVITVCGGAWCHMGIEHGLAECQASILPAGLSLGPHSSFIFIANGELPHPSLKDGHISPCYIPLEAYYSQ